MLALRTWSRALLLAFVILLFSPVVMAQSNSSSGQPVEPTSTSTPHRAEGGNSGYPMFGILIIAGVVGFFILIAWIISRVGEGNRRPSDNTMS
jgi:hypothetical protein